MKRKEQDLIKQYQFKDRKQDKDLNQCLILNIRKETQMKMILKTMMTELRNQLNQRNCNIWLKKTY